MSYASEDRERHLERLRAEYQQAFEEWALQVDRLQTVSGVDPTNCATKEARRRVEAAENAYRETRDLLARDLLAKNMFVASR
jgi:hypothetical protein